MNKTKENPNYYSIIPANVRYDKRLKPNEKLLYSEITALTNSAGQCWASNKYFAELYDVTKDTVSKWINHLKELDYITVDLEYYNGEVVKRTICLTEKNRYLPKKRSIPL